jgi:hypothetical protein
MYIQYIQCSGGCVLSSNNRASCGVGVRQFLKVNLTASLLTNDLHDLQIQNGILLSRVMATNASNIVKIIASLVNERVSRS